MNERIALSDLGQRLCSANYAESLSTFFDSAFLVVDIDCDQPLPRFRPECPIVAVHNSGDIPPLVDIVVADDDALREVTEAIRRSPIASQVLVQLTRQSAENSVRSGLVLESLAYSTLQHGAEFESWLHARRRGTRSPDEASAVLVERHEDELHVTLNRPTKRNAWSVEVRDGVCEALHLLADDQTISRAVFRGNGSNFCAGGDLDEFGDARDAAIAHATRTTRSIGRLVHLMRHRIRFQLHGACIGAGIEVPAFADDVVSTEDATFALPEVQFGLVPGAGGTVSIPRRIGRHRFNWLAITGNRISAETALDWGLVDSIC